MMRRHAGLRAGVSCLVIALGVLPVSGFARSSGVQRAQSGGTVIAGEADTPSSFNPYLNQQLSTADVDSGIFDGLIRLNDKGQFTPDLATHWTSSNGGTRWVFYLNHKATWQDGVPVTAKDVVFTTKLVNNPLFPATSTDGFSSIKTIKAVGDYEVDVTLTKPSRPSSTTGAARTSCPNTCWVSSPWTKSAPTPNTTAVRWAAAPSRSASSLLATI